MRISLFSLGFLLLIFCNPSQAQWASITLEEEGVFRSVKFKNPSEGLIVGHDGIIIKTSDKGETWHHLPNELSTDFFDFQFINDTMIYAYGSDKIYISTDFGTTWKEKANLPTCAKMDYFLDLETGFAGGNIEGLRRTIDGGMTWNMHWTYPIENYHYSGLDDIVFIHDSVGFACGRSKRIGENFFGNIIKTDDRGETWSVVYQDTLKYIASQPVKIHVNNDSSVIVVDELFSIIKSDNFGGTWSEMQINLPDPDSWFGMRATGLSSLNRDTIFVGSEVMVWVVKSSGQQKRKILRTTNGGQDWILQFFDDPNSNCCGTPLLGNIHFLNDTLGFAAGNNLILRTTNTGGDIHIIDTVIIGSIEILFGDQLGISIYPNPTTNDLTIELMNDDYRYLDILSMSGRMLGNCILNQSNHFDLAEYPAGVYILRFSGKKTYYHRIIKTE